MNIDDSIDVGHAQAMKPNTFVYEPAKTKTNDLSQIGK